MTHPGLPLPWVLGVWGFMLAVIICAWLRPLQDSSEVTRFNLVQVPLLKPIIEKLTSQPGFLLTLRVVMVVLFSLIVVSGLFGSPLPERNAATVLTWNLWWTGLIISVFFLGSAWCAVCPWDTLSTWLVRRRLWKRAEPNNSLNLRIPKSIRNVWPALILFIGLTWLELGVGITMDPYTTALVALFMVVLAVTTLSVFERRGFCRYLCPVGRTVGFYSQLAPVELRPISTSICADCTTRECYYGDPQTEPCPTQLLMGTLKQNTYCTSCGNCARSCPHENIAWRLRSPSIEAIQDARPHWDESCFMLILLGLTLFHGLTMLSIWQEWTISLAQLLGDSGQLLLTFTIGMGVSLLIPIGGYGLCVGITYCFSDRSLPFKRMFSTLAFVSLPLAFAYHLAHNLTHLVREGDDLMAVMLNPLGLNTVPLSMAEKHMRHMDIMISQGMLFTLQALLLVFGFWIAIKVILHRGRSVMSKSGECKNWQLGPMFLFAISITAFDLWLLMQPMTMRM